MGQIYSRPPTQPSPTIEAPASPISPAANEHESAEFDLRDPRSPTQKRTPLRTASFGEDCEEADSVEAAAAANAVCPPNAQTCDLSLKERRASKSAPVEGSHSPVVPIPTQQTHFVYPGKTPANTPLAKRTVSREQLVDTTALAAVLLLAASSSPAKSMAPALSSYPEDKENTPQHSQNPGSNTNTPTADSRKLAASGKMQSSPMHAAVRKALLPVVNANQVH